MPAVEVRSAGDIFNCGADGVVIPVNTVGTMGAGLAKDFAKRFPFAAREYREWCRSGDANTGLTHHEYGLVELSKVGIRWAFFLPTKEHWRDPSRLEWIASGLESLVSDLDPAEGDLGPVDLLAIPALGCGCGGLAWDDVRPLIEAAARRMFCAERVVIFAPAAPHESAGRR